MSLPPLSSGVSSPQLFFHSSGVSSPQTVAATPATTSSSQEPISRCSVTKLCGARPIVVSYGYSKTDWTEVGDALRTVKGDDNVWDYGVGSVYATHISASGEEVIKIEPHIDNLWSTPSTPMITRRRCQAALINVVFHNYRLMKSGKDDFVPVIFNISLSRTHDHRPIELTGRITLAEIEMVRKLCTDDRLPADFREMARKTVKFVHVEQLTYRKPGLLDRERTEVQKYFLTEVGAPWENAGYAEQCRKVEKIFLATHPEFIRPTEKFDWYKQLAALLDPNAGFIPHPTSITSVSARPTAQAETAVPVAPSKAIEVGEK